MSSSERILRQAEAEREYYYDNDFNILSDEVVFDRSAIVTRQPFPDDDIRNPLPISTIDRTSNRMVHTLPITGLALLLDINEVSIEQTIEIDDLIESESRYHIKTDGQIIYGGVENSSALQRLFCGSGRRFNFRLFDRSKQEALYLHRRLAPSTPLLGCYLQKIEAFEPPCNYIGSVQQEYKLTGVKFSLRGQDQSLDYTVTGPSALCPCLFASESFFTVYDPLGRPVSEIAHSWDPKIINYKLTVKFPERSLVRQRALLLACGILLEYMFFQTPAKRWCRCCCK